MSIEALQRWRDEQSDSVEVAEQKNPYQKWLQSNTRKTAIGAFCMSCMGTENPDMPASGYRADIKGCSSKSCPLYNWRPYQ